MLTKYVEPNLLKRDPISTGWWGSNIDLFNDGLFGELLRSFNPPEFGSCMIHFEENEDDATLSIDLPGVKPDEIEASADGQRLTFKYKLRGKERTLSYNVNPSYDVAGAAAKLEHGVLELRLPRHVKAKGKKIDIAVK